MMRNLGTASGPVDTARLREAARRVLALDDEAIVMVRQLDCTEPGCAPVETVVAVLAPGEPVRSWKLRLPAANITDADLAHLLATEPEGVHTP